MSFLKQCAQVWILPGTLLVALCGLATVYYTGGMSCGPQSTKLAWHKPEISRRLSLPILPSAKLKHAVPRTSTKPPVRHTKPPVRHTKPPVRHTLPIAIETFLYMSMGPAYPSPFTFDRGCFPQSAMIFLSFLKPVNLTQRANCNCSSVFFPKSTWSTGRNELLRHGILLEKSLGWRYEFFIFTDDDISLIKYPGVAGGEPEMLFRSLLLKDRPVRAGVRYRIIPLAPLKLSRPACARACYTDANIDAYHRTAVDLLLPYVSVLDDLSWFLSGYIVNVLTAILTPDYCHIYRQLGVNDSFMTHRAYPDIQGWHWSTGRMYVDWLLEKMNKPELTDKKTLEARLRKGLYGSVVNGKEEECNSQPEGVDYTKMAPRAHTLP